ncbi:hypothetical protein IP88_03390 [alpha proteobacterium AAP81b]|nr:hypothetical protein IP88_03390 [alpha proteobacterium AAP81b]
MASGAPGPTGRVGALDSLRLLAAGLVVVQHLFEGNGGWIDRHIVAFEPGVAGVALFFFISGYAIALASGDRVAVGPFLRRRLWRIYPLYLAVLAVLVLLGPTGVLPKWRFLADAGPVQWLANLLLVQDFVRQRAFLGVSWTLIIELAFYALFAAGLARRGARAGGRLMVLAAAALLALALASLLVGVRVPLGRPLMILAALLGWQCLRFHRGGLSARGLAGHVATFAVVATVVTLIGFGRFHHATLDLAQVMLPWAAATLLFLGVLLLPALRGARWLSRGPLPWAGAASYSIYLLHPLAIEAASVHFAAQRIAMALLLTALFAAAGRVLVERPGIALGRRFGAARLPLAVPR